MVMDGAEHTQAGRLFVVENLSPALVSERSDDSFDAIVSGALRTPFSQTFILVAIDDDPTARLLSVQDVGFIDDAEQGYGLRLSVAEAAKLDGRKSRWRIIDDEKERETWSWFTFVILAFIADSRSTVTLVEADDKLNKARVKRGKAPIPPYWKIEAGPTVLVPNAASAVATKPGNGTHASPRPHDRRGHPRHLKSGREVWVRACKINALLPHLTKGRSFYEVRLNQTSGGGSWAAVRRTRGNHHDYFLTVLLRRRHGPRPRRRGRGAARGRVRGFSSTARA
jgi:hypothetical protein